MYKELIEKHISNRGLITEAGSIHSQPSNFARYASMFLFGKDIQAHVKANRSVKDFKGKIYADSIWIDIDAQNDLDGARNACIDLVRRLNVDYQVNPDHVFLFFSGNKGFHLCMHNSLIGFLHTEPVTADKVKDFVRRLSNGIPCVDLAIYEPVRIFRIENSQHEKSALYKIRISFEELQCEVESIKALAAKPRIYPYKNDYTGYGKNEKLNQLWQNSGSYVQEQTALESKGNLFAPPQPGNRNKTLLIQACTLFRKSELSAYAILDIISNAAFISSLNTSDKIDEQELKRIVTNAERLVGDERKKTIQEEINIKSFGEWIPEWENYTLQQQTPMSLCFSNLNNLMRGRLRGKLGVIMGYGGSKKSLNALNICLRNIRENNDIAIYSTMEMSAPQLINRIIDHEVKPETGNQNASIVVERMYKADVNAGRGFLLQLAKALGNRLQIVSNSRMTKDYYKQAIQKVKETTGQPTILVVDGLSMMGGKGSETEVYSQNSADLKELANEENMLVLLICHVSKGAEKHSRDLSKNIRGSEKILDNCDFYMTMSQVQDDLNLELYNPLKGFINFHDKRGSGQSANAVFDFDALRLKLMDTGEDPKPYMMGAKRKYAENDF